MSIIPTPRPRFYTTSALTDAEAKREPQLHKTTQVAIPYDQRGTIGRIREMFNKVELSVSSYDTAWVARIPSLNSPQKPCFPECLDWVLENQLSDGSWSLPGTNLLLTKASIMSTLSCVLALAQWDVAHNQMTKGLEFVGSNFGAIIDEKQVSPIGFDIIFPGMIEHSKDMDLNIPLSPNLIGEMLRRRDSELERVSRCNSQGSKAYMAYVSEGLTKLYDWKEIKKYQLKNGSVLNSPSATAAFLVRHHDAQGFEYLHSLLKVFKNAVPTIYPTDVYIRLCMVDHLKRLGISRHFSIEIKSVLDETYRCWLQRCEDIFLDIETSALAFRLLQTSGYEVSSDVLSEFNDEEHFFSSKGRSLKDIYSILELYKASEIMTSPDELVLESLHSWTSDFLKQELSNGAIHDEKCLKEVEHSLKFGYEAHIERLETRRNIECYTRDSIRVLKASYRCLNIDNREFLQLAVEDFNFCQGIHQKELKSLERWIKENRLDTLKFVRQKVIYAYFLVAGILFTPELSDARVSWTRNVVLITMVDDRIDVMGHREELENIIKLVEKWEGNSVSDYCSEEIEIIFLAIHKAINELGAIASAQQGRSVTDHLIELWLTLLKSMLREHDWVQHKSTPKVDDYMEHAHYTIGVSVTVLMTNYFLGHKLSEAIIRSAEYNSLFKHAAFCCRLLNDIRSFKIEAEQGKLNSVILCMIHEGGDITEEEAVKMIRAIVHKNKREALRLVLKTKGSIVPRACKDILWNTSRVGHFLYSETDGFSSPDELLSAVNAVINEPIKLPS